MSQTTNQLLSTIAKLSTWWSQFNPNHRITTKWLPVLAPRGESPHQVYHLTRVKSPLAKSIFFVLKNPPPKHEMDGISPWNDDGNDDGNDGSKNSPPMMIFIILWNSQNKIHMFYDHRMKSIHKFPVKSQNVIGKSQKVKSHEFPVSYEIHPQISWEIPKCPRKIAKSEIPWISWWFSSSYEIQDEGSITLQVSSMASRKAHPPVPL